MHYLTWNDLRQRLGTVSVSDRVSQGRWFGHVEQKDADNWVSVCKESAVLEGNSSIENLNKNFEVQPVQTQKQGR